VTGAKLRIQQCSWIARSVFGLTSGAQAENLGLVFHSGAGPEQLSFYLRDVSGRRGCFLAKVVKTSDASTITFFSMGEKVYQLAFSKGLKEYLWIRVDLSSSRDWWHELPGLGSHANWESAGLTHFFVVEVLGNSPEGCPTSWAEMEDLFDAPEKDYGRGLVEKLFQLDLAQNDGQTVPAKKHRRTVKSKKKSDLGKACKFSLRAPTQSLFYFSELFFGWETDRKSQKGKVHLPPQGGIGQS